MEMKLENISLDLVVPMFNEEQVVQEFHKRLIEVLDKLPYPFKIYYLDDGSSDSTFTQLISLADRDNRIFVVQLSRNFGHQATLTAGLDLADADIVITMDGDGQHAPELIPTMIDRCIEGYDIVQTQRIDESATAYIKKMTAKFFYWLINSLGNTKIIPGTADFRLMTRPVVLSIRDMKEYHRFIRGIIPWLGYRVFTLPYFPQKRISGKSKYTLSKMFELAENAIFSFSLIPLRIGLFAGFFFIILAIIEAIYVLTFWITGKQDLLAPGWSSIVFLILITGGSLMIMISLLGIYIGQINQEVKHRPVYIIRQIYHKP